MIEALLKGLLLGLSLSISVGPIIFAILKQSISNGHKGGISFILGVSASDITLVVLGNTFTAIFDSIRKYTDEIGIAGSVLFIVMGLYFVFFKKAKLTEVGIQKTVFRKRDYARIFLSGYFMNILNPAVIIIWFSWATFFATQSRIDKFVLFVSCLGLILSLDFAKVFLAGRIRSKLTPVSIMWVNRISGLFLIGFGIVILWGILILKHHITH